MKQQNHRLIIGAFIIVYGALALLDNMHLFGVSDLISFWPTFFIVVGVVKLAQTRNQQDYVIGAVMLGVGFLLLLGHMGLIAFGMHQVWPLLLIGLGLLIIFRGRIDMRLGLHGGPGGFRKGDAPYSAADADSTLNVVAVISGSSIRKETQDFRGGEITAVMGGVDINLRQASIQSEAVINVSVTCGGVVLKVPADWTVICNAVPVMGGIEDKTVPPAVVTKRLIIEGHIVMGAVEIKN
jgi:hypothetical protein